MCEVTPEGEIIVGRIRPKNNPLLQRPVVGKSERTQLLPPLPADFVFGKPSHPDKEGARELMLSQSALVYSSSPSATASKNTTGVTNPQTHFPRTLPSSRRRGRQARNNRSISSSGRNSNNGHSGSNPASNKLPPPSSTASSSSQEQDENRQYPRSISQGSPSANINKYYNGDHDPVRKPLPAGRTFGLRSDISDATVGDLLQNRYGQDWVREQLSRHEAQVKKDETLERKRKEHALARLERQTRHLSLHPTAAMANVVLNGQQQHMLPTASSFTLRRFQNVPSRHASAHPFGK